MSKPLSASKKVMTNYLSELLTDDPVIQEGSQDNLKNSTNTKLAETKRLEALLKNVSVDLKVKEDAISTRKSTIEQRDVRKVSINTVVKENKPEPLVTHKSTGALPLKDPKAYRKGGFQALFFNVGGLTVAVPLIELGGIYNIDKTTTLMGKPNWFKGVMLHRDEKINIVDTALWVMPEKCDDKMKSSLNYQYVIMLNNSGWGLAAENIVDTVVLKEDEVKWLDSASKRPWLAGLVKDKMCALLDVDSLVQLLNDGSGIYQDN
ncbi:chemotaxis protein CheW [Colwellia sp. MSW7]|uniref:Chemotaxis protein CheW n=1 Tax=Colwellia maritima TaxID=2912588 RepID=A0ABS9X2W8_9GAMM|nr:chemotaxis protein CheW [Colwellia maritima]MCI2284593.1 chemotaxis protein CheW [Colwellia maritima]